MRKAVGIGGGMALWVLATGCLGSVPVLPACDGWQAETALCGFMNPEDLARLPGSEWVLVSEMTHATTPEASDAGEGASTFVPGRLTAVHSVPDRIATRRVLFPAEWSELGPETARWGEPDCPGPPTADDFAPHGIDVGPGPGGVPAVAVVVHGAREVIDLFAIESAGGGPREAPALRWRGCVEMLDGRSANDVALADGGTFYVTDMLPRIEGGGFAGLGTALRLLFSANTGSVLVWQPGAGLRRIAGSEASAPNGIAVRPGGRAVWIAEWGAGRVTRLELAARPRPGEAPRVIARESAAVAGQPDNLTWTLDRSLLVAAQDFGLVDVLRCGGTEGGGCDLPYAVTRVEPDTLAVDALFGGRGGASVALERPDEVWVGVFRGDRIERRPR